VLLDLLKTRSIPAPATQDAGVQSMRMLANVRIIANTSYALEGRAQGGLFNPELLEKLNVFRIEMPPLSKRQDEFEDIALGILGEITRELHREHLRDFSPEAWSSLKAYEWPANIRELRNVLKVAVISAQGDRIEAADLPEFGHDKMDFRATRAQFEKTYLSELLKTFAWDIDRTCRMAGLDRSTLLSKIQEYRLSESQPSV
jgi:DNA-binding NtrC family response regulator